MRIIKSNRGNVVVIAPNGRLTVETEAAMGLAVRQALAAGKPNLVLDLGAVPYIDSCGLGLVAQAYVAAFRRGGTVKLANVTGRNLRLLTITKLLTAFEVFDGVDKAVESFGPEASMPESVDVDHGDGLDKKRSTMATNSAGLSSLG